MFPRIKSLEPMAGYRLDVIFDSGEHVIYDVGEDIKQIRSFAPLRDIPGLFAAARLDESRTCVYWNDQIDLASDSILEYGMSV